MNTQSEQPPAPAWIAMPSVDAWALIESPYFAMVTNVLGAWTAHVAARFVPGRPLYTRLFGSAEAAKTWAEAAIARLKEQHNLGDKIEITIDASAGLAAVVDITDGSNRWVPSFKDLFHIIQAIAYCEREKYHYLADPLDMPRRFFQRCLDDGVTWEQLRQEFKLPDR